MAATDTTLLADGHCFVCHIELPPTAQQPQQQITIHTHISVYELLESILGQTLCGNRSSRWCEDCLFRINDYDLAVMTARARETELIALYKNAVYSIIELEEDEQRFDGIQKMAPEGAATETGDHETYALVEITDDANKDDEKRDNAVVEIEIEGLECDQDQQSMTNEVYLMYDEDEVGDDDDVNVAFDGNVIVKCENDSRIDFNLAIVEPSKTIHPTLPAKSRQRRRKHNRTMGMVQPQENTGPTVFSCERCRQDFETNTAYKLHIVSCKSKKTQLVCDICAHVSWTRTDLLVHMMGHSGVQPFECVVCGRQFAKGVALRRHMPLHTGEKPYQCDQCGKQFIHHSSFTEHRLAHANVRSKQCTICGIELRSSSHLTRHLRVHSGEKPHACPTCGLRFAQRYNMMTHYGTHQGIPRAYRGPKCGQCGKHFGRKSLLQQHVADEHGQDELDVTEYAVDVLLDEEEGVVLKNEVV